MTSSDPERQGAARAQQSSGGDGAEVRVAAGLRRLDSLDALPLPEHGPVYEGLHDQLQAVLAEIDSA